MKSIIFLLFLICVVVALKANLTKTGCKRGLYKPVKTKQFATIDVVVVDLFTTMPRKDVEKSWKAIQDQVMDDFAPLWGVVADIKLLPRGEIPKTFDETTSYHFLIEALPPSTLQLWGSGGANHYFVQPSPNESDGPQPNLFDSRIPLVPYGTPVVITPYGSYDACVADSSSLQCYGLTAGIYFEQCNGCRYVDELAIAAGHETMETLGDPFAGFCEAGAHQLLTPGATDTWMWVREVVDPVEFCCSNTYFKNGVRVTNFVTPDYFNAYADSQTCLDFLGNIEQPLTPNCGLQGGFHVAENCFEQVIKVSNNPGECFIASLVPVYGSCPSLPPPVIQHGKFSNRAKKFLRYKK